MDARGWRRPELGFMMTASSRLAAGWDVLEGALEWITLILGVLIGVLTVVRLVLEMKERRRRGPSGRRWERRRSLRRRTFLE